MIQKALIVLLLMGIAGACGFYFAPGKVETKTVEVLKEIEKVVYRENRHVNTKIIETIKPDGTIVKETYIVDETVVFVDKEKEVERIKEAMKIVETQKPQWKVSASTNILGKDKPLDVYQLSVDRRILGPIFVGIYGRTDKEFGAGVGIEF